MSATFEARYGGKCSACGEAIKPGQEVRYAEDDLIHDVCEDSAPIERPSVICQTCWLAKPCGCEDD